MKDHVEVAGPLVARPLRPIAEYKTPGMPTDVATKRLIGWAWRQLREPERVEPFMAESNLYDATGKTLGEVAGPPACGPLMQDFDEHFRPLLSGGVGGLRTHLVLLPPGDRSDILGRFALNHGLDVAPPPQRQWLLESGDTRVAEWVSGWNGQSAEGDDVLVVPELERWFLRHEDGLTLVRRLLDLIDSSDRRIIVGCSTWRGISSAKPLKRTWCSHRGLLFSRSARPSCTNGLQLWKPMVARCGKFDWRVVALICFQKSLVPTTTSMAWRPKAWEFLGLHGIDGGEVYGTKTRRLTAKKPSISAERMTRKRTRSARSGSRPCPRSVCLMSISNRRRSYCKHC